MDIYLNYLKKVAFDLEHSFLKTEDSRTQPPQVLIKGDSLNEHITACYVCHITSKSSSNVLSFSSGDCSLTSKALQLSLPRKGWWFLLQSGGFLEGTNGDNYLEAMKEPLPSFPIILKLFLILIFAQRLLI